MLQFYLPISCFEKVCLLFGRDILVQEKRLTKCVILLKFNLLERLVVCDLLS